MNRFISRLKSSLAFKVVISTLVLSLVVIYAAGSALNSRLSSGIKQVNLDSALIEARSTIFSAQYRFVLAQSQSDTVIKKLVDEVISSATTLTSNENAREVIFLRSPGNSHKANYELTSNAVDLRSIPDSLRKKFEKVKNLNGTIFESIISVVKISQDWQLGRSSLFQMLANMKCMYCSH